MAKKFSTELALLEKVNGVPAVEALAQFLSSEYWDCRSGGAFYPRLLTLADALLHLFPRLLVPMACLEKVVPGVTDRLFPGIEALPLAEFLSEAIPDAHEYPPDEALDALM